MKNFKKPGNTDPHKNDQKFEFGGSYLVTTFSAV